MFASNHNKTPALVGRYWVGMGEDPEHYRHGDFATEGEAVAEAMHLMVEDDSDRATIGIGEEVFLRIPDADDVIEMISLNVYEECGDGSESYLESVPAEQKQELSDAIEQAVAAWMTKHNLWPDFCSIKQVRTLTDLDKLAARTTCEVCGRGLIQEDKDRQDGMCERCSLE